MPYGQPEFAGVNEMVRLESVCSSGGTIEVQLRSNVHDALWMLSRQYDIGEFKGENAGSALKTLVTKTTKRINRFKNNGYDPVDIDNVELLEPKVEKTPWKIDILSRIKMGRYWNILLKTQIVDLNNGISLLDIYLEEITNIFGFSETSLDEYQQEILDCDSDIKNISSLISGNLIDGWQLYDAIKTALDNSSSLIGNNISDLGNASAFASMESRYKAWIEKTYKCTGADNSDKSWNPESLEYSFEISAQENTNTASFTKIILNAKEYQAGKLDWYSFNLSDESTSSDNNRQEYLPGSPADPIIRTKTEEFLPSKLSFKGAMSSRWWEFDDAIIDLKNIRTERNDITKILTVNHLVTFTHDWQIIPLELPVGSITEIDNIEIIDAFGDNYHIESLSDPSNCSFFTLNLKGSLFSLDMETRLLIPPVVAKRMESKPIEEVMFVRDEMANMVWAIEKIAPDLFDGGVNGKELANMIQRYYEENINFLEAEINDQVKSNASKAYKLAATTPENWIPMLPVMNSTSYRDFQFQRATAYRIVKDVNTKQTIRPKTNILLADGEKLPENNIPYFINEEEILRHGITVQSKYQRARDYDGSVKTWLGREKHSGKIEYSDYKTDVVLPFNETATLTSNDRWTQKTDLLINTNNAAIFSIGSKIYVVRGILNSGQDSTVHEYDTNLDTWTQKDNWPNGYNCLGCTVGDLGYVIGGKQDEQQSYSYSKLFVYDSASGFQSKGDVLLNGVHVDARINGILVGLNEKLYFGLGELPGGAFKHDWYEYDITNNLWIEKQAPPMPITQAAYFTIQNKLYVVGGGTNSGITGETWCFNPAAPAPVNPWSKVASIPDLAGHDGILKCGGFSLNEYGYVCCGEYPDETPSSAIWQYDPENDAWGRKTDFPGSNKKIQSATVVVNGKAYIVGGKNDDEDIINELWEYEF